MPDSLAALYAARFGETTTDAEVDGEIARQLKHVSHRRWSDQRVSDATLDLLFSATLSVPTKSDLMQYAIIHASEQAQKDRVAALIPEMPWIADAPVFLLFCGDSRRIRKVCDFRGTTFEHDPVDAFFNAGVDAALAMATFIRAAEAQGLVTCPVSAVREPVDDITRLFELPDHVFPVAGLCVGYPDWEPWVSLRLPPRVMVHRDRYDDSNFEQEIASYDERRRAVNPIRRQRDVERYGEKAAYGWSDDKARQVSHRERVGFGELIRKTFGF